MMFRTESGQIKKVGFYETETKPKNWHRYADIIVPMITLPLIFVIGLYLSGYVTDQNATSGEYRTEIFALSSALLITSFIVFIYILIRLSAVLGGRTRLRLPIIRSNRSNACFMKSVNSDLEFMTPLNSNHRFSYESIIFDVPSYPKPSNEKSGNLPRIDSEQGLTI